MSYRSTQSPGELSVRLERRDGDLRVSWLMPAGQAWNDGVRPGMRVISVDGAPWPSRLATADFVGLGGETIHARVIVGPWVRGPMKWSLWALSLVFAGLGAIVTLRRPDHETARILGFFCGATAVALATGPAAGGTQPPWSLVVQFVSVVFVGVSVFAFALAVHGAGHTVVGRTVTRLHGGGAILILAAYGTALAKPTFYPVPRVAVAAYFSLSVLGAVIVLAAASAMHGTIRRRQQARVVLFGILFGTSFFVGLTLFPLVLGRRMLLPAHLTILPTVLIPVFAAVAITQFELIEIRRLVHRGMVYTLTTALVGVAVVLFAFLATPIVRAAAPTDAPLLFAASVLLGVAAFYPLRASARWLVDRFVYTGIPDPQALIEVIRSNVLSSRGPDGVRAWMEDIRAALRLEAIVLFAGDVSGDSTVYAVAGERARHVIDHIWPDLASDGAVEGSREPCALRWRSEELLLVPLRVAGERSGYLLLGPKEGGEVFLAAERRMVGLIAPVLALAVHESELSGQLRVATRRLVEAEEAERARLASDLHDGPLQKAILLGGGVARAKIDHGELARELTRELREVCSRLRPSILDDLGLAPALEWLLEQAGRRFGVAPGFALHGVDDQTRFPIAAELALFRITQEAINNAVKHGKATAIDVSLARNGESLVLTVEDNGVGFVAAGATDGFGVPGMRARALQLGGSLDLRSVPGAGARLTVRMPYDPTRTDVERA